MFSGFVINSIVNPRSKSLAFKDKVAIKKTEVSYNVSTKSATLAALPAGEILGVEESKTTKNQIRQNSGVYLGFAVVPLSSTTINSLESSLGRKFDLLMGYVQWGNPSNSNFDFTAYTQNNKTPLISWEPWNPNLGISQPDYKLSNITSGKFDNYIRAQAQLVKKYNKPIFLRFAHEMNGNWYPWGGVVNGNSTADYIAAWTHIHQIFTSEAAANVTWVWSPDTKSYPDIKGNDLSDYYPGDNFVDWVGLDGYNWGTTKNGKGWETFSQIFSNGYKKVLGYNKPIMIAETASTEEGGDKGKWIEDAFSQQIPNNFPKIKALVWFNVNKETNWEVGSSPNSISHLKKAIESSIYSPLIQISGSKIVSP